MRLFYCLLILILPFIGYANPISISFGPVQIGQSNSKIELSDFSIKKKQLQERVEASFVKGSVQWIRTDGNLLAPRVLLAIKIYTKSEGLHLKYQGSSIIPERQKDYLHTEIYVSLFNPSRISFSQGGKPRGYIYIQAKSNSNNGLTQHIDYSCARYNLQISGLEDEYLSAGCMLERKGEFGSETPRLQVTWTTTNFKLLDNTTPPFISFISGSNPSTITVQDYQGKRRKISIKATLPKRLHRLKTAVGFGPYSYKAGVTYREKKAKISPSFMLYSNLNLSPSTSIRAFDALIWQDSIFNNFGLYFAYELADAFDKRVSIVPLLGIQGLSFRYNNNTKFQHRVIYPQGFEVLYKHAFGIKNYSIFYGMFIGNSHDYKYKNLWLRWGQKYFWEINYISWQEEKTFAEMWGLSIGLPFMSFF
jgi:hypothetical protein